MKSAESIDQAALQEQASQSIFQREAGRALSKIVDMLRLGCAQGKTLDIGSGNGALVAELVKRGIDAYGLEASDIAVAHANQKMPGRFTQGTVLMLPYEDGAFESLVSIDWLQTLDAANVPRALREMHRVCARFVLLRVATIKHGSDSRTMTLEDRAWWERACFEAGFRKSPLYYLVNDYASLNHEGSSITILLEKIPAVAARLYPLAALAAERDLHMDMMREVGERSDAHIVRYQWASGYIRPGDRVLDAACGLGYGAYVLSQLSEAGSVVGVDGSRYAVDYARHAFSAVESRVQYQQGLLPQDLSQHADGSFDAILSFETLEHVEDPQALLGEFHRLLSPGGRIVVSVPNDWSDESGEDPNPFHLHVYTWDKLKAQLSRHFLLEDAFAQTASACKVAAKGKQWERRPRSLNKVAFRTQAAPDCEWLLMVGMKDPVGARQAYAESVYGYSSPPDNLLAFARDYRNPWLVRALVEFPFRAKEPSLLRDIAERVLQTEKASGWPDEGAALAVLGYQMLGEETVSFQAIQNFLADLSRFCDAKAINPHALRWQISLRFLMAKLQQKAGLLEDACQSFERVAFADCMPFSPTLGTKVVDAAYEGGMLYASKGELTRARALWRQGVQEALRLLRAPEAELVGDLEYPQQFSLIVAVEFLDSATRCVKALRWTNRNRGLPLYRLEEASQQCWKWMIAERTDTIKSQEVLIRERNEAIAGQARYLEQRWEAMQQMEAMLRERDAEISGQARYLEERWEVMQKMEAMIRERDALIADQDKKIREHGEIIADQSKRLHSLRYFLGRLFKAFSYGLKK